MSYEPRNLNDVKNHKCQPQQQATRHRQWQPANRFCFWRLWQATNQSRACLNFERWLGNNVNVTSAIFLLCSLYQYRIKVQNVNLLSALKDKSGRFINWEPWLSVIVWTGISSNKQYAHIFQLISHNCRCWHRFKHIFYPPVKKITALFCRESTYNYLCSYCAGPLEVVDIRRPSKCTNIKHPRIVWSCWQKCSFLADANISI